MSQQLFKFNNIIVTVKCLMGTDVDNPIFDWLLIACVDGIRRKSYNN